MKVRFYKPVVREDALATIAEVLRSGWLGMGPVTERFERAFADYVGAPHAIATSSCTGALHIAVRMLDIPAGAEVITTPVTFIATNHALLYEHLVPVFADVEPQTGNLDINSVRSRITDRTAAIMIMHYSGYPCDLDAFYALSREYNLPIIEDCAHACGAIYRGRPIGSHDSIQTFSFDPTKVLTAGGGGAVTFRAPEYRERLARLRYLGMNKDSFSRFGKDGRPRNWDYSVMEVGFRYHMTDVCAAIGLAQLAYLDQDRRHREKLAHLYSSQLAGVPGITLLRREPDRESSHSMYTVLVESRDDLANKLEDNGIGISVHFRRCDSYPMYELQDLPNAEYFCSHTLSLPMHTGLTEEEVLHVTKTIAEGW